MRITCATYTLIVSLMLNVANGAIMLNGISNQKISLPYGTSSKVNVLYPVSSLHITKMDLAEKTTTPPSTVFHVNVDILHKMFNWLLIASIL